MKPYDRRATCMIIAAATLMSSAAAAHHTSRTTKTATTKEVVASAPKPASDGMTLRGGQEGTALKSLTIQGEDRVHLEIERPSLELHLDPLTAPGLELGNARDVLERTAPDWNAPFLAASSREPSPYVARPWLTQFASGVVARFHPNVEGTERWRLLIADSRGQTVMTYEGHGKPPSEIAWDGRTKSGGTVVPGLTYSYAFEAYDRAGNKRSYVGEGFKVAAYRLNGIDGPTLVFSGAELTSASTSNAASEPAPILLEAATWINESSKPRQSIQVTAIARSFDQASALAGAAAAGLARYVLGDPTRIRSVAQVEPDAPEGGTLKIAAGR